MRTNGIPEGKWHLVLGWSDHDGGVLQLACTGRDRNISWALDAVSGYFVARSFV